MSSSCLINWNFRLLCYSCHGGQTYFQICKPSVSGEKKGKHEQKRAQGCSVTDSWLSYRWNAHLLTLFVCLAHWWHHLQNVIRAGVNVFVGASQLSPGFKWLVCPTVWFWWLKFWKESVKGLIELLTFRLKDALLIVQNLEGRILHKLCPHGPRVGHRVGNIAIPPYVLLKQFFYAPNRNGRPVSLLQVPKHRMKKC